MSSKKGRAVILEKAKKLLEEKQSSLKKDHNKANDYHSTPVKIDTQLENLQIEKKDSHKVPSTCISQEEIISENNVIPQSPDEGSILEGFFEEHFEEDEIKEIHQFDDKFHEELFSMYVCFKIVCQMVQFLLKKRLLC